MKRIALAVALAVLASGCRSGGQVPPATNHVVSLTWSAPVTTDTTKWKGCAGVQGSTSDAQACLYALYKCTLSAAACGDTTNVAWGEITTSATRVSGLAYTDSNAAGQTAWYVAKTFQGASSSGPSNIAGPFAVPGNPTAPAINGTVAANDTKPLIAVPAATQELAKNDLAPVLLTARVR